MPKILESYKYGTSVFFCVVFFSLSKIKKKVFKKFKYMSERIKIVNVYEILFDNINICCGKPNLIFRKSKENITFISELHKISTTCNTSATLYKQDAQKQGT